MDKWRAFGCALMIASAIFTLVVMATVVALILRGGAFSLTR